MVRVPIIEDKEITSLVTSWEAVAKLKFYNCGGNVDHLHHWKADDPTGPSHAISCPWSSQGICIHGRPCSGVPDRV
jgi:hypothetical protein